MTLTNFLLARCSVADCDQAGKLTRGMCLKHYRYWLDHTPPEQRPTAPRSFWDFVDKSGDCWVWIGPTNRKGYGWWSGGGVRGLAHRISLSAAIPCPDPALLACHRCDNPPCVKPSHLYWGTVAENARDLVERGTPNNQNSLKTHCKRGHELAGENLRITGREQRRQCRTCDNERSRQKMATRRARAKAGVP